jgi:hypothetical protein
VFCFFIYNEYFEQIAFNYNANSGNARVEFTIRPNQIYYFKTAGWLDACGSYGIVVREE